MQKVFGGDEQCLQRQNYNGLFCSGWILTMLTFANAMKIGFVFSRLVDLPARASDLVIIQSLRGRRRSDVTSNNEALYRSKTINELNHVCVSQYLERYVDLDAINTLLSLT